MDSVAVTVPLRPPTKKMKKRKELNALATPRSITRRSSGKRSSQELLSDSSDNRSEYWNVSAMRSGMRKVQGHEADHNTIYTAIFRVCGIFLASTIVLITIVLIWLFIDVRQQLTILRVELDQVIAGIEDIPDALQTCHTLDKNFKSNITHITAEIQKLNGSVNTFSEQISNLHQKLQQIQISLKATPELTSVPNTVKTLQNSIGELEINIHDLQITNKILKNTTLSLQYSQDQQIKNLIKIKNDLGRLPNTSQLSQKISNNETFIEKDKLWELMEELQKNLTSINRTLTMNIIWTQEDLSNHHKKIVFLQDVIQNTNAQILTFQQECMKKKDYEILQNLVQSLLIRIDKLSSKKVYKKNHNY